MGTDKYVVVLGDSGDATLSPEMKEWLLRKHTCNNGVALSGEAKSRVSRGIYRARKHWNEGNPVSGLIFTSGYRCWNFEHTVASAMEMYATDLFPELEMAQPKSGGSSFKRPPLTVNRDEKICGMVNEMRWAYQVAKERSGNPRLEFVASEHQHPWVHLANWTMVLVLNYAVVPISDQFSFD